MKGIWKRLKYVPVINQVLLVVLLVNACRTLPGKKMRRLYGKLVITMFLWLVIINQVLCRPLPGVWRTVANICSYISEVFVLCSIIEKETAEDEKTSS